MFPGGRQRRIDDVGWQESCTASVPYEAVAGVLSWLGVKAGPCGRACPCYQNPNLYIACVL